jgi:hypothetical protein
MTSRSIVPCDACNARDVVPHEKRRLGDALDPTDHQIEELCGKCGGSGRMVAPLPPNEG